MRRDLLSTNPREGDYILSPTGFTWNVLRSTGAGGGTSMSTGDRDKKTALAKLRSIVHEAIVRRELTGEADSRLLSGLLESERRWSSQ